MDSAKIGEFFRLSPGGIECDKEGLRIGGVAILRREDGSTTWSTKSLADIDSAMALFYGAPIDAAGKMAGLECVAKALSNGDLARAQVAALLLRLPDASEFSNQKEGRKTLFARLVSGGLLAKDWDESEHPRAGVPPNPGWFAPKDDSAEAAPTRDDSVTVANISCNELYESDYAICNSAAFADDHHYRGLCLTGAFRRNAECLAGISLSPLLPY